MNYKKFIVAKIGQISSNSGLASFCRIYQQWLAMFTILMKAKILGSFVDNTLYLKFVDIALVVSNLS